jgi:iron complex transport system substrate-binding protein
LVLLSVLVAAATVLRIISLAPALTEDIFAIGAGAQVVAVDAYSNRPAAAARLPRVGTLREANGEAILALRPTLVVGITYQAPVLADLARAGVRTEALSIDDVAGDLAAIERLGLLTGHLRQARSVREHIAGELQSVARQAARRPLRSAFVVIGQAPLYTAGPGSFIDDLLRLAHLRNIVTKSPTPWPQFSAERLVAEQPDIVVVPDPSAPLSGTPWDHVRAVRDGRVLRVPEDDLLHPGPNVAKVLRTIAEGSYAWR